MSPATRRRHSDAVHDKALALVAAGASYFAAAKELGISHTTVMSWCRLARAQSTDIAPAPVEPLPDDGWKPGIWVHPYARQTLERAG